MQVREQRPRWINESNVNNIIVLQPEQMNVIAAEEAEKQVLGSILMAGMVGKGKQALESIPFLQHDDFFIIRNGMVFRAMERLYQRGDEIDVVTVCEELRQNRATTASPTPTALEAVGGEQYVNNLAVGVSGSNLDSYARIVVYAALRRALLEFGDKAKQLAMQDMELDEAAEKAQEALNDVLLRVYTLRNQNTFNLYDALDKYQTRLEAELEEDNSEPGLTTGLEWMDKFMMGGYRDGKLYVIAGRPAMGKTAFMLCNALAALKDRKRVVFFSLEMQLEELLERIVCIESGINYSHLQCRKLQDWEREASRRAFTRLKEQMQSREFQIVVMSRPSLHEIRAKMSEFRFSQGFDVAFVDYAGSNTLSPADGMATDRYAFTSHIFSELKELAKKYGVPVVAGCQLNRKCESRPNKRPILSDLTESGVIEQVADVVIGLYRDVVYNENTMYPELAEAGIIKNRSGIGGKTATVKLNFDGPTTKWSNWRLGGVDNPQEYDF